jgi:hypothetical protein
LDDETSELAKLIKMMGSSSSPVLAEDSIQFVFKQDQKGIQQDVSECFDLLVARHSLEYELY